MNRLRTVLIASIVAVLLFPFWPEIALAYVAGITNPISRLFTLCGLALVLYVMGRWGAATRLKRTPIRWLMILLGALFIGGLQMGATFEQIGGHEQPHSWIAVLAVYVPWLSGCIHGVVIGVRTMRVTA